MPSKKKKFDKKNADSYTIVHRSQQDPATHDEEKKAPTRVFQLLNANPSVALPQEILPSEGPELPRNEKPQFAFGLIEVDEDIIEALEGDEEGEWDELDDDFVKLAQMEKLPENYENRIIPKDEGWDEVESEGEFELESEGEEEEKKPRIIYTEMDLGEQRNLLEERFEKVLQDYDDSEEEDFDSEGEEEGTLNPNLEEILDEFLETTSKQNKHEDGVSEDTKRIIASLPQRKREMETEFEYLKIKEGPEFDCESITSTYSNLYNHPKLIEEPAKPKIKLSSKTGLPLGVLNDKEKKQKTKLENKGQPRNQNETPEERKERKKQIKQERKESRQNKKNLKQIFRAEQLHQQHLQATVPQSPAIKL